MQNQHSIQSWDTSQNLGDVMKWNPKRMRKSRKKRNFQRPIWKKKKFDVQNEKKWNSRDWGWKYAK